MSKLLVTEEMLKIKSDLELVNSDLETMITNINTNLDSIVLNWTGNKSKEVLTPVESIKLKNLNIIEKIKSKSEEIGKAYETYLKNSETAITEKPAAVSGAAAVTPAASVPSKPVSQDLPTTAGKINEVKSNNIYNMDSSGNYSRVINYQGASWNYFTMRDPLWGDWQLNRNSTGFKPLAKNGSHPFATINIFANSGLVAGNKEDIVIDVLGVSGIQTKVDGKSVGDGVLNLTTGQYNIGGQHKYKTILKGAGIQSTILPTLDNAITEVEKGNVVHCIAQEGSSIAKLGHYLTFVGVEKNKNGDVTGLYVLDSIGKSQSEFDSISKKANSSELVRVIEPGLVRIDASKENLKDVRLASFRSIDGGKSITKTVFSYEDYLKGNY